MKIATPKYIAFMSARPVAVIISAVLITASLFFVLSRGMNFGIDFLGGLKLTYHVSGGGEHIGDGRISQALSDANIDAQVQQFGTSEEQRFLVKIKKPQENPQAAVAAVTKALAASLGDIVVLEGEDMVSSKVGQEMSVRGQKAIIFILVLMLLYIGFRFDFMFAPGAVVALAHDVMITLGVLALLGVEFNLTILAAVLTIAGYSINDTIIIYDRIREHSKELTPKSVTEVINRSLSETLPRTIVTSITTFIAVMILFSFAGGDIRDFALTFMVGILTGTYSSLLVASPVYLWCYKKWGEQYAAAA